MRWLIAPVLLVPMLGCEGRSTTDTLPWRCNDASLQCPMTTSPAGLAGFWQFDEGDLGGDWQGDQSKRPFWYECGEVGGEWGVGGPGGVCGSERLGGTGASLRLGGGYVSASLPARLQSGPMTLAAWMSIPRGDAVPRRGVVSVLRPECQSAWLDVLTEGTKRSLVLAVEKPGSTGAECDVEEVIAPLPSGFLDWGIGTWYHVAGVVDGDERAVYVDGELARTSVVVGEPKAAATEAVHIGASPTGEPLQGMIDDVALFDRAVGSDAMSTFALESISISSGGQQWTPWSVEGSSASWKNDCRAPDAEMSDQGVMVSVDNGYWSAGGLRARVPEGRGIRSLKKAILVADIPAKEEFNFVLGSRHNAERCTWHVSGKGKGRYEFDLADVNECDCPSTCDCAFEVEEARVASRWDKSTDLSFSVCGVEFEWSDDEQPIVALGPGGMRSLNGWCWRPVSYHEGAFADLDESQTNWKQAVGTVRGRDAETALLAADFALGKPGEPRRYCNLMKVQAIKLTADMPHGFSYQFRVADFYGVALEWSDLWHRDQPTRTFPLCIAIKDDPETKDCGEIRDPIRHLKRSVDQSQVRFLGVQKNYESGADTTPIAIKSVEFEGTPADNCVISTSSGGAPPE